MKAQVLTDFIIECTIPDKEKVEKRSKEKLITLSWILHIDGASNVQRSWAKLILTNLNGIVMKYFLRFDFHTTNNGIEYEALITNLKIAKEIGIDQI